MSNYEGVSARLTHEERCQTYADGTLWEVAVRVGANIDTAQILKVSRFEDTKFEGDEIRVRNWMQVSVEWVDGDQWHMGNLRLNNEDRHGLSDYHFDVIDSLTKAQGRPAVQRDFTRVNGIRMQPSQATPDTMEVPATLGTLQPAVLANAAA